MSLKLYSWNINGIRANLNRGTLQKFLNEEDPDIACLQETRLPKDFTPPKELKEFHQYWAKSERPGYSGVAVLSKKPALKYFEGFTKDVKEKYSSVLTDKYGDASKEGRIISVEFENFWIISVYTPNSKGDLGRLEFRHKIWDPAFKEHILELSKEKPVFAAGDFNVAHNEIDLAKPKENRKKHGFTEEERSGFNKILKSGSFDSFRKLHPDQENAYTWWSHYANSRERNVGWRIDYWLMTNDSEKYLKEASIHPQIMGSDHCPISITLEGIE